ncbi:MAG: lysophospholipid acyltransferase family protein [Mycobacterium sp.]|uniref:lysophospholipid acyltransferase family protein n=1 Tax=Mycobacterium sp. TaxID=1785 RepID=UPI003C67AB3C
MFSHIGLRHRDLVKVGEHRRKVSGSHGDYCRLPLVSPVLDLTWVVYTALRLSVVGCRLLLPQPQPQWRWRVAWGSIRLLARLTRVPVAVHGLDHLSAGTSIAVANHPRWIDPLVLASVMPQSFHLVAAEVLEHQGLNGLVFRRLGHQFVERHEREHGVADADRLATPMRGGRSLVIFPEGGLVRPPGCALSTWAHSWWPPKPACPLSRWLSAGRGQYCGQSTICHNGEPSTSPLVSRSGLQAQTGLRRLNCSMPRETRLCASRGSRTSNDK